MKIFLDYFDALRAENVDLLAHLLNQLTNIAGLSNVHITLFSNSYYTPFIFNISPILCNSQRKLFRQKIQFTFPSTLWWKYDSNPPNNLPKNSWHRVPLSFAHPIPKSLGC